MPIQCPECGQENAFISFVDDVETTYECPDCDYEWTDSSEAKDDDDDFINSEDFKDEEL